MRAEIESDVGRGSFAAEDGRSTLPAKVVVLPARHVAVNGKSELVEGDLQIEFDIDALRRAGRFRGRLVITCEGT